MNKVYIIGIGPGVEEYLLPIAKKEIEKSDCLIGSKRILALFQNLNKEKINLERNYDKVISYIKENKNKKRIAVLVSGDPGLYSFLVNVKKILKKEEYVIIPGVSMLQLAFAKIGETWHDAKVITLHGRKVLNLVKEVKTYKKIFLFTDENFPPDKIAKYLFDRGIHNRRVIVLEKLSYPDERIIDTDIKNLSNMKGFELCVLVIKK